MLKQKINHKSLIFSLDNHIYLRGELINNLIKAGFSFYTQYSRNDPDFTTIIKSCTPTAIFELFSYTIAGFNVSPKLRIFVIHWSDNFQKWNKPNELTPFTTNLGLPFAYFLALLDEAHKYAKTLPPLRGVSSKGYYPQNFFIGEIPIL